MNEAMHMLCDVTSGCSNRRLLPEHLRPVYDRMLEAAESHDRRLHVRLDGEESVKSMALVWTSMHFDHPGLFYIGDTLKAVRTWNGFSIAPEYLMDGFGADSAAEKLASRLSAAHREVWDAESPLPWGIYSAQDGANIAAVLRVHDKLAEQTEYTWDTPYANSAAGWLSRKGVCGGISSTASLVLNYCGIPCETVLGKPRAEPEEWHAWNTVRVGNGTAHLDVTNDCRSVNGMVSHRFFLMDEEAAHTRLSWRGPVGPPTGFDYYRATGTYADSTAHLEELVSSLGRGHGRKHEIKVSENIGEDEILDVLDRKYLGPNEEIRCFFDDKLHVFSFWPEEA